MLLSLAHLKLFSILDFLESKQLFFGFFGIIFLNGSNSLLVTDIIKKSTIPPQGYTTHTLRLHSCWEITNHGVVNMVHSLPNLTSLSLSGCSKITDDGVELVAENLRKLRSLDLSWCPRITDMALEYIACDLHKLEELVLDRSVFFALLRT